VIPEGILNRLADRLAAALAPPRRALRPWIVDGAAVGYLDARRAALAADYREVFAVAAGGVTLVSSLAGAAERTAALDRVTRDLAQRGELTQWRDERYAVRAGADEPPLFDLERAAARFFGIRTEAAHVNGVTHRDALTAMWIARRSASKSIDPGQLDNLVGGGVATSAAVTDTLVKEAWEEAGIAASLAATAQPVGTLEICRAQPDGLQRDTIHVHDLALPAEFVPTNQDGEVVAFMLVAPERAAELAGNDVGPDVVTADAALVVADWLMRNDCFPAGSPAFARIEALRHAACPAWLAG
jgi:8-oxo-dGTP pyrophosphatase MutT (NUDIX family)